MASEGTFTWSDGTPWGIWETDQPWATGEPNDGAGTGQDCVLMLHGKFEDRVCGVEFDGFICKYNLV